MGLHPADVAKLLKTLDRLVEAGNTVLVVEHDPRVIAFADRGVEHGRPRRVRGERVPGYYKDLTPSKDVGG